MMIDRGQVEFQHVKLIQIESHDIVYSSHGHIQYCFWLQKWQYIENNICSQNCPNESQYGFAHYSIGFCQNHVILDVM